jgi:hypothetical protein
LKDYLVKGYSINARRFEQKAELFKELQDSVKVLREVITFKPLSNDESIGLLKIISDYSFALEILDRYDYQNLKIENTSGKGTYQLTYEEAINQINTVKRIYGNSTLFVSVSAIPSFQIPDPVLYSPSELNDRRNDGRRIIQKDPGRL